MKKIILLNICSLILINLAYGSFPSTYIIKSTSDTIKTESIKEYHQRIQKMGIDDCMCESCRGKDRTYNKKRKIRNILIFAGALMLLAITLLMHLLYNAYTCLDTNDNCSNEEEIGKRIFWINLLAGTSLGILLITWLNKTLRRN